MYALFTDTMENYKNIKSLFKNTYDAEHFQWDHKGLKENDSF